MRFFIGVIFFFFSVHFNTWLKWIRFVNTSGKIKSNRNLNLNNFCNIRSTTDFFFCPDTWLINHVPIKFIWSGNMIEQQYQWRLFFFVRYTKRKCTCLTTNWFYYIKKQFQQANFLFLSVVCSNVVIKKKFQSGIMIRFKSKIQSNQ